MKIRPLRRVLTVQSLLAVALPFAVVAFFGMFWIVPEAIKDAEDRQLRLSNAVGVQVKSHLEMVAAAVKGTAAMTLMHHDNQQHLDAMLGATDAMSTLYRLGPNSRISAIALRNPEQYQQVDLYNLDMSSNPAFIDAVKSSTPQWSDTFLSVVNGGLAVAYILPSSGQTFVGEVDLERLTKFLKRISTDKDVLTMIVDHRGQVVADSNGRYTAQQLNLSNIPMVRTGIDSDKPASGSFDFEGHVMIASIVQIPDVDWHVLVVRTNTSIYQTFRRIGLVVLSAILIALLGGVLTSVYLARKLSLRFDALARHAHNFAAGDRSAVWPVTSIAEFNQLSENLQTMADTLRQQELVLRDNESRMTCLYNISQYPFTSEKEFLDHALEEIIGLTGSAFGYIYFYSEQKCQFTLSSWSHDVMRACAVQEPQTVYDLDSTGIWGEAVRQRQTILLNDFTAEHPLKKGLPEGHPPLQRFLTVPVMTDDSIVAVVGVANKDGYYLDSDAMQLTLFMDAVWKIVGSKRAEQEHKKLEQQLLHAQKLESLGVLAGGIAHDFNNILTAIIGNADLALMRINRESPAVDNLHRIEQAASRAADLAKQMLAYSGKGRFVVECLDMNRLLEEMLHILEVSISKKAVLRFNLTRPLPGVEADATQMRQIIMNLVINASEAIGDRSGVIAVTTGCMDCDSSYLKGVWLDENLKEGLYVYLEIADTGCGMDKDTLAKLFDPFFTTKFTGRGLGMAAVLGIVRGHHGAIKVYSEPGKGSSFKIMFPTCDRPVEIFNGESGKDDWSGSGTVLLVDDEETIRGIGAEMLKALGFATITASDGREALEIYKSRDDIAFVILDLTMPHMDGEQCFRELRRINPAVKVIMSSGYNEQEVTEKFVGKGLSGFVQKPYRLNDLKEAIKRVRIS